MIIYGALFIPTVDSFLLKNKFKRIEFPIEDKSRICSDIKYGQTNLRIYRRGQQFITVQFQPLLNRDVEIISTNKVWSLIFGDIRSSINTETWCIDELIQLGRYEDFHSVEDIVKLCKFIDRIKLVV